MSLFKEVIPLISDNITTTEIDEIIAFKAADKIIQHPDYSLLGGRILLSRQSKLIGKELQPVDLTYDFFAATTFLSKYSLKDDKKTPTELPSCMYNRVAGYLHDDNEDNSGGVNNDNNTITSPPRTSSSNDVNTLSSPSLLSSYVKPLMRASEQFQFYYRRIYETFQDKMFYYVVYEFPAVGIYAVG